MEKEIIRALKLFGREDLTDGTYDLPELDSNIEVFMTPRQMIYYMSLETQLKKQKEIIDRTINAINLVIKLIKSKPKEDDSWILDKLDELLAILEDKEV